MSPMQTVELQPQAQSQAMVAEQAPVTERQLENGTTEEQKPRLSMRGGGLILDLCACFICCEACDACCHAIDDCCCC